MSPVDCAVSGNNYPSKKKRFFKRPPKAAPDMSAVQAPLFLTWNIAEFLEHEIRNRE
jgi:hypothetical protein